jgi:hypothetical protein
LQFAKAGSAATVPQQEKKNTAVAQRGRVNKCYRLYVASAL